MTTEGRELGLYAVNNSELYRSRIVPIIANLQKKIRKGIYNPTIALKLWRYAADDAAKRYTFDFDAHGGARYPQAVKGYGIFTTKMRDEAARYMADHYAESLAPQKNPKRRAMRKNPIKGPGKWGGETYLARSVYDTDGDEDIGSADELGWFRRFSGMVRGRGPFHVIVSENDQGQVYSQIFSTEKAMLKKWRKIEKAYEDFYDASGNDF